MSEFTKGDIVKQFNINEDKIIVTYEGVSADLITEKTIDTETDSILSKYKIHKPFLLYVGNAYPHKNLERLIQVFSQIDFGDGGKLTLVLVGKDDYFYNRVKDFAHGFPESKIIFPGFVPDNELAVLYHEAVSYVFPSLYEGFGLPPLEAMATGCPVLSSSAASMPEILGQAAFYFDPENDQDMRTKIETIINDGNLRMELAGRGTRQANKYNWDECAKKTLDIFNNYLIDL